MSCGVEKGRLTAGFAFRAGGVEVLTQLLCDCCYAASNSPKGAAAAAAAAGAQGGRLSGGGTTASDLDVQLQLILSKR